MEKNIWIYFDQIMVLIHFPTKSTKTLHKQIEKKIVKFLFSVWNRQKWFYSLPVASVAWHRNLWFVWTSFYSINVCFSPTPQIFICFWLLSAVFRYNNPFINIVWLNVRPDLSRSNHPIAFRIHRPPRINQTPNQQKQIKKKRNKQQRDILNKQMFV